MKTNPRCANKECRERFTPNYFGRKFCFKDQCNDMEFERLKAAKLKQSRKRMAAKKKELETVQDLMKKAQKAFNAYIRERDKGKKCISCKNKLEGKHDAGHFISSGSCKYLTFDENNVHGQCVACNQHKHGNLISYREELIKRIGEDAVLQLEKDRHKTANYTREELRQIEAEYKKKLK